jgi:hypothetical protein
MRNAREPVPKEAERWSRSLRKSVEDDCPDLITTFHRFSAEARGEIMVAVGRHQRHRSRSGPSNG